MRILVSGAAAAAFALGSMTVALAAPCTTGGGMMRHAMPKCSATTGPVVWYMASAKTYFVKGSSHYGKGMGMYVCRATAVARGGHPGMGMMGGSHGSMGGSHGSMGGSHAMPGSSTPASAMPSAMTMAPRPMPPTTPGPGLPNSTNAAPGSMGSPMPMTSGSPASGNQGNTGAPGAGGQVPNNPASSSNSNPNPSPSPHP
jgi:hypothetical protein